MNFDNDSPKHHLSITVRTIFLKLVDETGPFFGQDKHQLWCSRWTRHSIGLLQVIALNVDAEGDTRIPSALKFSIQGFLFRKKWWTILLESEIGIGEIWFLGNLILLRHSQRSNYDGLMARFSSVMTSDWKYIPRWNKRGHGRKPRGRSMWENMWPSIQWTE